MTGAIDCVEHDPPGLKLAEFDFLMRGVFAIDIVNAGGSHRDVAEAIYGADKVAERWGGPSCYYEDWARRLVARARFMVNEGYLGLLGKKTL